VVEIDDTKPPETNVGLEDGDGDQGRLLQVHHGAVSAGSDEGAEVSGDDGVCIGAPQVWGHLLDQEEEELHQAELLLDHLEELRYFGQDWKEEQWCGLSAVQEQTGGLG